MQTEPVDPLEDIPKSRWCSYLQALIDDAVGAYVKDNRHGARLSETIRACLNKWVKIVVSRFLIAYSAQVDQEIKPKLRLLGSGDMYDRYEASVRELIKQIKVGNSDRSQLNLHYIFVKSTLGVTLPEAEVHEHLIRIGTCACTIAFMGMARVDPDCAPLRRGVVIVRPLEQEVINELMDGIATFLGST